MTCTVKRGLRRVQIGTALLVKVSVFGVNCLQLQVSPCMYREVGGGNLHPNMIIIYRSECYDIQTNFHVSSYVENTVEYYRTMIFLIILKGIFSPSNSLALV